MPGTRLNDSMLFPSVHLSLLWCTLRSLGLLEWNAGTLATAVVLYGKCSRSDRWIQRPHQAAGFPCRQKSRTKDGGAAMRAPTRPGSTSLPGSGKDPLAEHSVHQRQRLALDIHAHRIAPRLVGRAPRSGHRSGLRFERPRASEPGHTSVVIADP